ncbi:histidine phosphatase family protein [Candidatus Saccharibacteria bacterium]|nr:histidine phosphatase family protein [Candidatus Saccharibacteria bacterium]
MPINLFLVRHGESEANVIQDLLKEGKKHPNQEAVFATPDWQIKLSQKGETQPPIAGKWLIENVGKAEIKAAKKYHSPYIRARQTAALLGIPEGEGWLSDDRIVERSWGIYGTLPLSDQSEFFPMTTQLKENNPWYAALEGGESLSSGVLLRVRNFLDSLHREAGDGTAIAVAHGELIWVVRYVLERMTPERWQDLDADKSQKVRNCTILQYSRVNPNDSTDIDKRLRWMRMIYPDNPANSPNNGEWIELNEPKYKTNDELMKQAAKYPGKIKPKK